MGDRRPVTDRRDVSPEKLAGPSTLPGADVVAASDVTPGNDVTPGKTVGVSVIVDGRPRGADISPSNVLRSPPAHPERQNRPQPSVSRTTVCTRRFVRSSPDKLMDLAHDAISKPISDRLCPAV